jgi:hypothetical protein
MYYNPETKETASLKDLKIKYNSSIPYGTEEVFDWYLLGYGERPEASEGKKVVQGEIAEVNGKYVYTYVLDDMTEEELAAEAANKLQEAKEERSNAVAGIRVTVDGMEFDGDETAQDRMSRVASIATEDDLDTEIPWVLADNTVASVTVAQIKEALRKALYAQAALWVKPYNAM